MFPQQPRHDEGTNRVCLCVCVCVCVIMCSLRAFCLMAVLTPSLMCVCLCVCVQITSRTVTALILLCGRNRDSRGWLWPLTLRTRKKRKTTLGRSRSALTLCYCLSGLVCLSAIAIIVSVRIDKETFVQVEHKCNLAVMFSCLPILFCVLVSHVCVWCLCTCNVRLIKRHQDAPFYARRLIWF